MIKIFSFIFSILFFIYSTGDVHSAGLANSSWPMHGANLKRSSRSLYESQVPLTFYWSYAGGSQGGVVLDANNNAYRAATNVDVIRSDGTLKCSTISTGTSVPSTAAIASDGTIYQGSRDAYLYAFDSDCSLKWKYQTGGQIWSSVTVAPDGTVYFGSRDLKIYALNPNGTLKWSYSNSSIHAGGIALDSSGNLYYGTDGSKIISVDSSGSLRWQKTLGGGAAWGAPSLSADEANVYIGNRTTGTLSAFRTSDGTLLWSYNIGGDIDSTPAIDSQGNIYVVSTTGGIYSFTSGGSVRWSKSEYADRYNLSLDNNGNIFFDYRGGQYVISSTDGSLISKYTNFSAGNLYQQAAIGSNGFAYFSSHSSKIVALVPWTLNLSVDNDNPKNGEVVNFTVKSSMLKRDPASSVDNKVQVKLPNGDKVELSYDSATTDSSGNALTVWKGSYTWNLSNGTGNKDVVAEAIAYKTTTSNTTFFNSLPTDFNNTGVSTSLCINSQGEGNCSSSSTTSTSPPPGFLSKGDYKLSYNASLDLGNSSPQVIKANNPNTFFDANKSLVILNPSSLSMDSLVMINPLTSTQLTTGDNPDRLKYTLPQSNGFTQTGDFWDLRAYVAYNGAGYTTFQNPVTLQLPYDMSKLNGAPESSVKILYLDKLSNKWRILPNSVINYQQKTVAALTKDATIFTVGVNKQVSTSRAARRPAEVQGVSSVESTENTLKKKEPSLKKEVQPSASLAPAKKANQPINPKNCFLFFCF